MWHSTDKENLSAKHLAFLILYEDKYKRVIYRCNHKYGNDKTCKTLNITEDEINEFIVSGINKILKCKKEVIENVEYAIKNV